MGVGTLRDDLLSLPDVEQAEIDDDSATPSAVRVRLAQGADPAATGEEIRRILALHGLRQENDVAPGSTGSAATSSRTRPSHVIQKCRRHSHEEGRTSIG